MEITTNNSVMLPTRETGGGSSSDAGKAWSPVPVQNVSPELPRVSTVSVSAAQAPDKQEADAQKADSAKQAALKAAMDAGNKSMKQLSPSLEFQIDPDTKQTVVRVVDTTNNEVIKQIPSAQFLRISSAIEGLQQHILNEKA